MKKYYVHLFLIGIGIGLYFLGNFQRVAVPGPVFNLLQSEFQLEAPYITALGSAFMYVYALNQLVVGVLVDKYGGLRVVIAGSIIFCIGSFLFPLSHSIWLLYLSRALIGLGAGTFYLSMVKEIKKCFADKDFSIALSVMMLIGYSGGIIANAPFVLCSQQMGWRNALLVSAFAALLFSAVFISLSGKFTHNPVNTKVRFGLDLFKKVFKNHHNINIFLFASLNFGLYYVLLTVIGKKFLEDFTLMSSGKAALYLSVAAVISAFAGLATAALSRICHGRKTVFLKICASSCFMVFLIVFLCVILNIKTHYIGLLLCLLAPGASMSPLLVPLIHETNSYEITGTTVSVMNCMFYLMVGILGNAVGFLMNVFAPISNSEGHLIYGKNSYILVFGTLLILAAVEMYNAFKLKDSKKIN